MTETGLADRTKLELVALARARGIAVSGTKAALVERLEASPEPAEEDTGPSREQLRQALADHLLADAAQLRTQMFAPTTELKAMSVADGHGASSIEIAQVDREQPTFTDQRTIAATIALVVATAAELGGSSAAGGGLVDELEKQRAARRSAAAAALTDSRRSS